MCLPTAKWKPIWNVTRAWRVNQSHNCQVIISFVKRKSKAHILENNNSSYFTLSTTSNDTHIIQTKIFWEWCLLILIPPHSLFYTSLEDPDAYISSASQHPKFPIPFLRVEDPDAYIHIVSLTASKISYSILAHPSKSFPLYIYSCRKKLNTTSLSSAYTRYQ
jgi:hypothetical protein